MGFFEDNYQRNSSNGFCIKWEYKKIDGISGIDLNALGEQGWEMCGYDGESGVAVFKRIKR